MGRRVPLARQRTRVLTGRGRGLPCAIPRGFRDCGRAIRSLHAFPKAADRELADHIATDLAATSREVALGALRYARNRQPPILAALPQITAPIVAINPDIGPIDVDSLRRHRVEAIVLEDVGHFLMIESPDQFNPVLARTLA